MSHGTAAHDVGDDYHLAGRPQPLTPRQARRAVRNLYHRGETGPVLAWVAIGGRIAHVEYTAHGKYRIVVQMTRILGTVQCRHVNAA